MADKKTITKFPEGTYTIKFANGEESDITKYDPSTRCTAIRDVNGKRDFTQRKGSPNDPDDPDLEENGEIDISGIKNKNARKIAKRLLSKKINNNYLNGAQLVGILANIKRESGFKPNSKGDYQNGVPTSFGICQWHNGRGTKMKNFVGSDWETDINGQVDYLWKELKGSYKSSVLDPISSQADKNTKSCAKKAMEIFCRKFEVPANVDNEVDNIRAPFVDELWKQIKIIPVGKGKKHNLTNEQIKRLVAGCIQENGSSKKAIQAEASLMCNLAESYRGKSYRYNVYKYVNRYGGWFGKATVNKIRSNAYKSVTDKQFKWGKEIFNNGVRTVPKYIDEHDWFPNDISWIKYGGPNDTKVTHGFKKSKLISGKSVIYNKSGATYTFWMFFQPNNGGDPYGSTYKPKRY